MYKSTIFTFNFLSYEHLGCSWIAFNECFGLILLVVYPRGAFLGHDFNENCSQVGAHQWSMKFPVSKFWNFIIGWHKMVIIILIYSLLFWFTFLWYLMRLRISTYWMFIFSLCELPVYIICLFIFFCVCFFFFNFFVGVPCIFWILIPFKF